MTMTDNNTTRGWGRKQIGQDLRFDLGWGSFTINPDTGACTVEGPAPQEWFDAGAAVRSARILGYAAPSSCDVFDLIAHAVNLQYAAWNGARTL
jgi:hypothetical protein